MLLLAALHRNRINERQFSKMRWRIGRICLFLNANVVDCLCSFHPQVATRCLHLLLAHNFYWQHSVFSMYIFAVYSSLGTFFFWFSSCPLLDYDYSSSFQLCWHKRLLFMIMLMWCQFSMLFSLILSPTFFTWGENEIRLKFFRWFAKNEKKTSNLTLRRDITTAMSPNAFAFFFFRTF